MSAIDRIIDAAMTRPLSKPEADRLRAVLAAKSTTAASNSPCSCEQLKRAHELIRQLQETESKLRQVIGGQNKPLGGYYE